MKKLLVAILAILYMGVSTGATLHLHYCMGRLIGWELWHGKSDACDNCGMKKDASKKGCCKDEHKQFKLVNDQKTVEPGIQLMQYTGEAILPGYGILPETRPASVVAVTPVSNSPPRSSTVAIFVLHRVFRI